MYELFFFSFLTFNTCNTFTQTQYSNRSRVGRCSFISLLWTVCITVEEESCVWTAAPRHRTGASKACSQFWKTPWDGAAWRVLEKPSLFAQTLWKHAACDGACPQSPNPIAPLPGHTRSPSRISAPFQALFRHPFFLLPWSECRPTRGSNVP